MGDYRVGIRGARNLLISDFFALTYSAGMSIGLVEGLIGVFAIILIVFLRDRLNQAQNGLPYPPGPKGLPVIGNVYDTLTDVTPQQLYAKWGREFCS
jgi:hypothetical protein